MTEQKGIWTQSGLTEAEAKEVHGHFIKWFVVFISFAIIAHMLVWVWRPWIETAG